MKEPRASATVIVSNPSASASSNASAVRAFARRKPFFTFEKASSSGEKSGEDAGNGYNAHPHFVIISATCGLLWALRLSRTTT